MDQIKIGKFIAFCRKEEGMTQAELAEKLGILPGDAFLAEDGTLRLCPHDDFTGQLYRSWY